MKNKNKGRYEGKIVSQLEVSHELYGETFLTFDLEIPRLSDVVDTLKVTVSERVLDVTPNLGESVVIEGSVRSYNKIIEASTRSKLCITIFADKLDIISEMSGRSSDPNSLELEGFICKQPIHRKTPAGRDITDILLAVNRGYNKSDYIPVIVWGRHAKYAKSLSVGEKVRIKGRLQSRKYNKKISETESICKVAYEVSVQSIVVIE